ncbi:MULTISPECIES: amidinotransferase [Streptomyces]|uniref:N-dimethylarginine dimethylaminohydrolase n=2 Tax=Streptomyces TaxID=1883 RepID=A0ABT9LKD6_STRGD|nr:MULTISPECIES: amidinotransferase [Streptomyces]MDP9684181.1 N-dimethylarginine dimethylaminohydrolase [Streptomyces griseoviridis]GGS83752.1 amidinotransferase [Streptomyces griseoviridis]GGU44975.1 amidinotransferase [Streptomyces daghestanicus]GHI30868.1 amidinotransferase [Streptomyces daghestanicus]
MATARATGRIGVTHEWGVLREAVVGRVIDFRVPEQLGAGLPGTLDFLPAPTRSRLPEWAGRPWSEADPEGYGRAVAQADGLARFLAGRGVAVHRPRELTEAELSAYGREGDRFSMQTFVRDPMVVVGDHVIETALRLPARFKERFGLRPVFAEAVARGARYSVMPPPAPFPLKEMPTAAGPFLEGGDVLLFGRDVLVGCGRGGTASDRAGARWLADLLGDGYRVRTVPLSERVIHLDDGLTAVREGLAVVCREQFPEGVPDPVAGWELIDVSLADAVDLLAGNSLVLAPGEVVVDERLTDLAEALTARDVTVHTLPFDAVTVFAGGFRCAHHPLVREPAVNNAAGRYG